MVWIIKFDPRAKKELKKLDRSVQQRILTYLKNKVAVEENPRRFGANLKGDKSGLWRYRIGNYRVICQLIDENMTVLVVKVGHRKAVYD